MCQLIWRSPNLFMYIAVWKCTFDKFFAVTKFTNIILLSLLILCKFLCNCRFKSILLSYYGTDQLIVHHLLLINIIKEIAITSELIWIYRWNQLVQRMKTENFFTLCFINLNLVSISGTGNVQPVFNLDPPVMKNLQCDILDSSINYFL